MNALVKELALNNVGVTLRNGPDGLYYNLNSGTKSWMYMAYEGDQDNGSYTVTGRYGESEEVYSLDDLLYMFADRFSARDFGDQAWLDLAVDRGVMERKVEQVVSYS